MMMGYIRAGRVVQQAINTRMQAIISAPRRNDWKSARFTVEECT